MRKRVKKIALSIRKISERASRKEGCIRLDIGQPSFDTPDHIKRATRDYLNEKQGYTSTIGIERLRKAIVEEEKLKDPYGPKGVELSKENVLVTVGGAEGIYAVFATLLSREDTVVLNDPSWVPYRLASKVNGNKWEQAEFFNGEELRKEAKSAIRDSEAVVVNTPNNPTGRVLTEPQARRIGEFCEETGTFLISDEVYYRLTFGKEHHSPAAYTSKSAVIGSVSKNHAMTGWRIGWIVASEDYIENFKKASRALVASPPKISQLAAIEALENDFHVKRMRKKYERRRDLVVRRIEELGWDFEYPDGAIYVFPNVGQDSWDFCLRMVDEGVAMVPGEPLEVKRTLGFVSAFQPKLKLSRLSI